MGVHSYRIATVKSIVVEVHTGLASLLAIKVTTVTAVTAAVVVTFITLAFNACSTSAFGCSAVAVGSASSCLGSSCLSAVPTAMAEAKAMRPTAMATKVDFEVRFGLWSSPGYLSGIRSRTSPTLYIFYARAPLSQTPTFPFS